jgi:lipopolysaccharide biosynthesis glycosyltransferase
MKTFCTIITADYYPKALALFKSIRKFNSEISLQVLVADNQPMPSQFQIPAGIDIIDVRELNEFPMVHELYRKYAHVHMNFFRWSLKPVFITYLLEKGFQKTIYLDCDMYFFNDYEFLFE